jgi:tRNA U34 5-carboxymethylaminomethyl modifying enzyme MnmG/GidA
MKDYELKRVEIGKFSDNVIPTGRIENGKHVHNIETEITKVQLCIIDNERNVAVNISTFNEYPIIKKNKYSQILPGQNINYDQEYAINIRNLKPEDIGILESIKYNIKLNKYIKQQKEQTKR